MMLWLKAFHIIAMVAWFSGLFYLPRLFVYHTETVDPAGYARFCTMEHRLYYWITTPSAVVTIVIGLGLLHFYPQLPAWMHAKLFLVGLTGLYHLGCGHYLRQFAKHKNQRTARFFRIFNEIPVLFLSGIVILVVVRPF